MSFIAKLLENSQREKEEEKSGNTKAVGKGWLSLDLNQPLEKQEPQLNPVLNRTEIVQPKPPTASEPPHGAPEIDEEEPEYCCNFCPKKFTNKQALGGHQNAHKFDKAIQKRVWQEHEANYGFAGTNSTNGMTSFAFPNPFNQASKKMCTRYLQPAQHQMFAPSYPAFMSPKFHESGIIPVSREPGGKEFNKLGTSSASPRSMPFWRRTEQGASTSKGKSVAIEKNEDAKNTRQINNDEMQHREDDLDLSLRL